MEPMAFERSAIYFKRHKRSKGRAALFRQLRASPANQTPDVQQQSFAGTLRGGCNGAAAGLRGDCFGTVYPAGFAGSAAGGLITGKTSAIPTSISARMGRLRPFSCALSLA